MKQTYNRPTADVIRFKISDVLTSSLGYEDADEEDINLDSVENILKSDMLFSSPEKGEGNSLNLGDAFNSIKEDFQADVNSSDTNVDSGTGGIDTSINEIIDME